MSCAIFALSCRGLLLRQPDFSHLTSPAVPAESPLPVPNQGELSRPCRFDRNFEFQRSRRPGLFNQRMNLLAFVAIEPNLDIDVATVHHSYLVLRSRIKIGVTHLKGSVVKRFRPTLPSHRDRRARPFRITVSKQRRSSELRVLERADTADEMPLARQTSEVVVESAGPGIRAVDNLFDGPASLRVRGKRADFPNCCFSHVASLRGASSVSRFAARETASA